MRGCGRHPAAISEVTARRVHSVVARVQRRRAFRAGDALCAANGGHYVTMATTTTSATAIATT